MSTRKQPVVAKTLAQVIVGRPDGQHAFQLFATLTDVTGPGLGTGREARVVLRYRELADLLGAIPALQIGPENIKAYSQVANMLHRLESRDITCEEG